MTETTGAAGAVVTLGEEIMLLSLDDESGAVRSRQAAGWAVAGGILLELVMAGRVTVTGKYLGVADRTPTGEPLLDGRLALMDAWMKGRSKRRVADWLTRDHMKAVGAAVERLAERGLVAEQRHKVMGLFPVRRYPESDGSAERALRARLNAAVLDKASEPDERTAGLIALLHAAKLHSLAFPDLSRRQVAPRMAEIAAGEWAAESVRLAIRDMQAAVIAATAAATAAAVS
ncbi:GPP34 family phosphoprotein [Streptomyces sp. NPDC012888]|uniref:GOLPH3/VPS74 family protein n=1 Tax=Streptomyces sp. NPDC012888 TaxID=3364855 RepID=UPI0036CCB209